jgi:type VI secretion system protein ImpF
MAELALRERLQPSLLDRLTDDEPEKKIESRERGVMSIDKLRACVLRDVSWLLNTGHLAQVQDLSDYPEVARSVVNYGSVDMAGRTASSTDIGELERAMQRALENFEPRILPGSLRLRADLDQSSMDSHTLVFVIEGMLWAQPLPLRVMLKTAVDLETGLVQVAQSLGR